MSEPAPETESEAEPGPDPPAIRQRVRRALVGRPRDLADASLFHRLALIPFLAWVGLGADGLSSSAYGPEEAYKVLGPHTFLAVALALLTGFTVLIISSAYSRIIEAFPHGGGGYVVASKLLGERTGVVSGCALLVDYVLTITTSIAAAGAALFSLMPYAWHEWRLPVEVLLIAALSILNIRGVRESVLALTPVFILFLITHAVLIGGGIVPHTAELPALGRDLGAGFQTGLAQLGAGGLLLLLAHAYSLGGGTYTGIEAVSNGLPIMRQPRVQTGKRTMAYMAVSLAVTASGLLLCYLLLDVGHVQGKTLNAVLAETLAGRWPWGRSFIVLTLLSEGALLVVAAQAGFLDGPRVLANMAIDSWMPHRFAALSERLTTHNGILLMGGASLAALLYTRGDIGHLIVMYSINVFLTFSLSMLGMLRMWWGEKGRAQRRRNVLLFAVALVLCATILVITVLEKFRAGGWITLLVTGSLVAFSLVIRRHYEALTRKLEEFDRALANLPAHQPPNTAEPDPSQPTGVLLVRGYNGLGVHMVLYLLRIFPHHFKSLLFLSVAVVDSGAFKGEGEMESLRQRTEEELERYVDLSRRLDLPAACRVEIATDAVDGAEKLCVQISRQYPRAVFCGGKTLFLREGWWDRLLHNHTALAVQQRLQWQGIPMIILPVRIR